MFGRIVFSSVDFSSLDESEPENNVWFFTTRQTHFQNETLLTRDSSELGRLCILGVKAYFWELKMQFRILTIKLLTQNRRLVQQQATTDWSKKSTKGLNIWNTRFLFGTTMENFGNWLEIILRQKKAFWEILTMFTFLIIYFVGIVVVQRHPFSIVTTKMPDYKNRQNRKHKKNYLTF